MKACFSWFQPLQVSALTLTNLSMSKTIEETRSESEKAKRELALRGEGYKSSLKVSWLAIFTSESFIFFLVPTKRETRATGNSPWATKEYIQIEKRGCSLRKENWCRLEEIGGWSKGLHVHKTFCVLTKSCMWQECHERCSRLKGNVKSLEENLQQKAMEVTHLQERWLYDCHNYTCNG